eukprot:scaffold1389_cov122-Cylindrotheca_fusiformis.AAC.13
MAPLNTIESGCLVSPSSMDSMMHITPSIESSSSFDIVEEDHNGMKNDDAPPPLTTLLEEEEEKAKRSVSFDEYVSVVHLPTSLSHEIRNRWYSKRELGVIKDRIRSVLRRYEDDDFDDGYTNSIGSRTNTTKKNGKYDDDELFGLERHLTTEREVVKQQKFNAKLAVFGEQFIQRQQGFYNEYRIGYVYGAYAVQCQQHAIHMAYYNAQIRLEEDNNDNENEETKEEEDDVQLEDLYLGESKHKFSLASHFGSCWGFWLSHRREHL